MTTMTFTIRAKNGLARRHKYFGNLGYPNGYPYAYTIADRYGWESTLLSKRDDYQAGEKIAVDSSDQVGQSSFYLDNTPAHGQKITITHDGPTSGEVNSDVIVMVKSAATKNGLTEITGEIFYFDPKLRGLPTGTLKDAFKDKARITVLSSVDEYYFNAGYTYIFDRLKDVTVFQGEITAKHGKVPSQPSP